MDWLQLPHDESRTLAVEVASGCKLKDVRMTSPTRSRRNRNRTRSHAAGTVESVPPSAPANARRVGAIRQTSANVRTAIDLQLIRQAVREGWPVECEMRRQIVEHVVDVALHDERAQMSTSCMRVLVAMTVANVRAEQKANHE